MKARKFFRIIVDWNGGYLLGAKNIRTESYIHTNFGANLLKIRKIKTNVYNKINEIFEGTVLLIKDELNELIASFENIIESGVAFIQNIENGKVEQVVALFNQNGMVDSPLYGIKKSDEFDRELNSDTSNS